MPVGLVLLGLAAAAVGIPILVGRAARRWNDDVGDYLADQHPLDEAKGTNYPVGGGWGT